VETEIRLDGGIPGLVGCLHCSIRCLHLGDFRLRCPLGGKACGLRLDHAAEFE
jgi:hypothetical protein